MAVLRRAVRMQFLLTKILPIIRQMTIRIQHPIVHVRPILGNRYRNELYDVINWQSENWKLFDQHHFNLVFVSFSEVQKKENVDLNKINLNHRNFLNYSFPRVIFSAKKNSLNDDSAKPVGSCPAACKSCHLPVKTQRDDGRPFSCTFCNKKYKSKNTLRIHQLVHAEKLHHCSLCPKSFYRKDHLAQHKAVHSNLKPFRCEICEKHFKHRNSLRAHQLVHSDDKPYQCPICFKSFRCGKSVERHEIAHARVRRFF